MNNTNQNTRGSNSTAKRCNQQQPEAPASGGDPPDPAHGFKTLRERWPEFVNAVKETHISAGSLLTEASPIVAYGGAIWVLVPKNLHRSALRDNEDVITEQLTSTLGLRVSTVHFLLPSDFDGMRHDEDSTRERPPLPVKAPLFSVFDGSRNYSPSKREAGGDSGDQSSVEYEDLFGAPPDLDDDEQGTPPPSPPPLDRPVSEAEQNVYEAAFRVAYERPGELMDVLEIVQKGLQRGQKSAESGGDYRG